MDDLKARLATLKVSRYVQAELVVQKRREMREADKVLKALDAQHEALAKYIHALDGQERDCPTGHDYITEPSGRGVGYDDRCRHCGYFRTIYPMY